MMSTPIERATAHELENRAINTIARGIKMRLLVLAAEKYDEEGLREDASRCLDWAAKIEEKLQKAL